MRDTPRRPALALVVSVLLTAASAAPGADWPRFRGPHNDGRCTETGLLQELPPNGPPLLWKITGLGPGYSSVAIAVGRLYTLGDRAPAGGGERTQHVLAYDLATRKELWAVSFGPPHGDGGPRCTPTVDGDRLYVLGTGGDLVCLATDTGAVRWRKHIERDLGGKMMSGWRWSESILVDGDVAVCTPGTPQATVVALDKLTGATRWTCPGGDLGPKGKDGAGYASLVVAEIAGVKQYVTLIGRGLVGVAAATGKLLWSYNRVANNVANITTPVVDGNRVFGSSAYGTGSAMLTIQRDGDVWKPDESYFLPGNLFQNHHGGVVLSGDCIYGGQGQNHGAPHCIKLATGEVTWKADAPGGGSAAVLLADGRLWFRYEKEALVALIAATPDGYQLKGSFKAAAQDGPSWAHPVISDGKLYLRAGDTLMCYDVRRP